MYEPYRDLLAGVSNSVGQTMISRFDYVNAALAFFHKWYVLAMQSKLYPVKKVALTFKAHLAGIVSIFKHGFCNALAEGVNSRIQLLMQKSCDYRNRQRLKTDILFHFGGLNMDSLSVQ